MLGTGNHGGETIAKSRPDKSLELQRVWCVKHHKTALLCRACQTATLGKLEQQLGQAASGDFASEKTNREGF
jgi:hypothetical protein